MPAMPFNQSSSEAPIGVWITRAEPGASATAARVSALGYRPISAPLLTFRPIDDAVLDPKPGEALAFTSINGVAQTGLLIKARDMTVFAVGDATAQAARAVGFSDVRSASGDVAALCALIIRHGPLGGVLHPAARETAGDLVGQLTAAGVVARNAAIYHTDKATTLAPDLCAALSDGTLKAVLLHSPRAARAAADLLTDKAEGLNGVCAVGLSQACLDPLANLGFLQLICAAAPQEDALLNRLSALKENNGHG